MGTAASIDKRSETQANSGVYGHEISKNRKFSLSSSINVDNGGSGMSFGNVIDTTLQFSQVEASPQDATIKAKVYKKSAKVRDLIRNALKKTFIFQSLTNQQLDSVVDVFSPFSCVVGETIINQGATGEYMYVVENGLFEVSKLGVGKLSNCGVGHTFGELALLYNAKRSATVTCIENASIWALDRHTFRYYQASLDKRLEKLALDVLTHVPLLKDLEFGQLARAAEVARTVDYEEGEFIITKGEVGHTFYIVLEGVVCCSEANFSNGDDKASGGSGTNPFEDDFEVNLGSIHQEETKNVKAESKSSIAEFKRRFSETKDSEDRLAQYSRAASSSSNGGGVGVLVKDSILMSRKSLPVGGVRLKSGEWFGEIALLTGSVRTANVIADSSCRLLAFDRDAFEKVLGSLKDIIDRKANNRILSDLPIIARLPQKKREAAASMFMIQNFEDGDIISQCGDLNPKFFYIKSGKVDVWSHPNPDYLKQQHLLQTSSSQQAINLNHHRPSASMKVSPSTSVGISNGLMDEIEPTIPPPEIRPRSYLTDASHQSNGSSTLQAVSMREDINPSNNRNSGSVQDIGSTWNDLSEEVLIPEPCEDPPPLKNSGSMGSATSGGHTARSRSRSRGHSSENSSFVKINKIRHTNSEGDSFKENSFSMGMGASFQFEPLSNVEEENSDQNNMKMMSQLSIEEKTNSGASSGVAKRSLPTSFDTSFEQMTSFEMPSFFASFTDSKLGQAEAQWRKAVTSRNRQNKKGKKKGTSFKNGESGKVLAVFDEEESKQIDDDCYQEMEDEAFKSQEEGGDSRSPSSGVVDCMYGDTFQLSNGEHIGVDAIASGAPMQYSMVAQGKVSCFILTREDLNYILIEGEENTNAASSAYFPAMSMERGGGIHSHTAATSNLSQEKTAGNKFENDPMESIEGVEPGGSPPSVASVRNEKVASSVSSLDDREDRRTDPDEVSKEVGPNPPRSIDKVITLQPTTSNSSVGTSNSKRRVSDIDWSLLRSLGEIGQGTFGTVYMMQSTKHGETYAMKVLNREKVKKMRQEKRLETETMLLKSLNCTYICRLYDEMQDDNAYYLLLEIVQGGELKRLIHPSDPLLRQQQQMDAESGLCVGIPHQPAKFYAAVISLPLVYLHRRSIAYRDLKPENVMIDRCGYPKLVDFGLAKPIDATGKTHSLCGTPEYLAPEVIQGHGHNQAVDYWALGVLLYEMIVGSSPFLQPNVDRSNQDHMIIFENIIEGRVRYSNQMEPKCRDLIQRLLVRKPAFRLGCGHRAHKEFEEHSWFSDVVDWHALSMKLLPPPWLPPVSDQTDKSCFGHY